MKNNIIKIICLIICIMMLIPCCVNADAIDNSDSSGGNGEGSSTSLFSGEKINPSDYEPNAENSTTVKNAISKVLGVLQVVGALAMVLSIALIGFYMMLGSAEEKATAKGKGIGILVGTVVLFGVSTIAQFIVSAIE